MMFVVACGVLKLGNVLTPALDLAQQTYSAHRAAKKLHDPRRMIEGSDPFLAERYLRVRSELKGSEQTV